MEKMHSVFYNALYLIVHKKQPADRVVLDYPSVTEQNASSGSFINHITEHRGKTQEATRDSNTVQCAQTLID